MSLYIKKIILLQPFKLFFVGRYGKLETSLENTFEIEQSALNKGSLVVGSKNVIWDIFKWGSFPIQTTCSGTYLGHTPVIVIFWKVLSRIKNFNLCTQNDTILAENKHHSNEEISYIWTSWALFELFVSQFSTFP